MGDLIFNYYISSNERRASNKRHHPPISTTLFTLRSEKALLSNRRFTLSTKPQKVVLIRNLVII